jgi:hypothetical protein
MIKHCLSLSLSISISIEVANRLLYVSYAQSRSSRPKGNFLCVTVATNFKIIARRESTTMLIIIFVVLRTVLKT